MLAVQAVSSEPVSGAGSLFRRENTGEIADFVSLQNQMQARLRFEIKTFTRFSLDWGTVNSNSPNREDMARSRETPCSQSRADGTVILTGGPELK